MTHVRHCEVLRGNLTPQNDCITTYVYNVILPRHEYIPRNDEWSGISPLVSTLGRDDEEARDDVGCGTIKK
jgi:hypothetical protein